jgi:hypothetical protein
MLIIILKFVGCEDYLPGRVGKTDESSTPLTVAEAAPTPPSPVTSNAALSESPNTIPLSSDAKDPSVDKDLSPVGENIIKTISSATKTGVKSAAGETDCKSDSTAVRAAASDSSAPVPEPVAAPSPKPDDAKTPRPEEAVPSPKPEAKTTKGPEVVVPSPIPETKTTEEEGTSSWDRKQEEEQEEGMEITDDVRDEFCVDSAEGGSQAKPEGST